jgi:hypothetical protein
LPELPFRSTSDTIQKVAVVNMSVVDPTTNIPMPMQAVFIMAQPSMVVYLPVSDVEFTLV